MSEIILEIWVYPYVLLTRKNKMNLKMASASRLKIFNIIWNSPAVI